MFSHALGSVDESFVWAGPQMATVPQQRRITLDPAGTAELVERLG